MTYWECEECSESYESPVKTCYKCGSAHIHYVEEPDETDD